MAYKNNLKESLMSEEITDSFSRQSYKLSYETFETEIELEDKKVIEELQSNLKEMSEQNIRDYISSKYIKKDEIEMEKLIKDLIIFKAYKCEVERTMDYYNDLTAFIGSFCIGIFGILVSINNEFSKLGYILFTLELIVFLVFAISKFLNFNKESKYNKLKTYSNAIDILESIKEDVYNCPEKVCDIKESNKEIVNDRKDNTENINSK